MGQVLRYPELNLAQHCFGPSVYLGALNTRPPEVLILLLLLLLLVSLLLVLLLLLTLRSSPGG